MTAREQIKILLIKEHLSTKNLAELLNKNIDKHYTQQSLLHKLSRGTLRYDEVENIAKVLGYKIKFEKTKN